MKRFPTIVLLILRIIIGWHFLYEGIVKLFIPDWSAEPYLLGSYGFLSGFFHWLASDPTLLHIVNFMNIWGMILIGVGLFLGVFIMI
jgi:thiosulfate dehydrogenase [quinone] large subunit